MFNTGQVVNRTIVFYHEGKLVNPLVHTVVSHNLRTVELPSDGENTIFMSICNAPG